RSSLSEPSSGSGRQPTTRQSERTAWPVEFATSRFASRSLPSHGEYRAAGFSHHPFRYTSQEKAGNSAPPMGSHHDQVDVQRRLGVDHSFGGVAARDHQLMSNVGQMFRSRLSELVPRIFLGSWLIGYRSAQRNQDRRADVQDVKLSFVFGCDLFRQSKHFE